MSIILGRTHQRLREFDFAKLFIEELGWDCHSAALQVPIDGESYSLVAVAQTRGFVAFVCAGIDGHIPEYRIRRKINIQVTKSAQEHLIIYADGGKTTQVWQWIKRELGKPASCCEHTFHHNQSGVALIQELGQIAVSRSESTGILPYHASRTRASFNMEKASMRFYGRFKTEHAAFLRSIRGISDEDMQTWYSSVMLNRLMFVHFIQKKGFLASDCDYLRTKLAASLNWGENLFYKDFLCHLFFEGFAQREADRSASTNQLLGAVPYLNGGLFLKHRLEQAYGEAIQIPDSAFARIFEFFDQYQWHLDKSPLRDDREITPDVLGHIFEKSINQKQMGAYYTKEDITGYISRNTVIPFLLEAVKLECEITFEGKHAIWWLLSADPDKYIYPAMGQGITWDIRRTPSRRLNKPLPLPPEIAAGVRDGGKRTGWNKPAPAEYALPTETWREVVARRHRYEVVRSKLANGEVHDTDDLITLNLDICQFAQDVIQECDTPELLHAFWHALEHVTVLDPTCGGGAFLLAAMSILEDLYEACLERMGSFLGDMERSGKMRRPQRFSDFLRVMERVAKHPSRKYFVYKSIVENNLYGVDIMGDAVEICKLRLFLKLVAQVERANQIEPLSDIDFNILPGNALVGFATLEAVRRARTLSGGEQYRMLHPDEEAVLARIEKQAQDVERLFILFRQQQAELDGRIGRSDKQALANGLESLVDQLNRCLATNYAIDSANETAYANWLKSHQPFHWFVEFQGIMIRGGFDVIIGNPPWMEHSSIKRTYTTQEYVTEKCGNMYAMCLERALAISSPAGTLSLIVQLPFANSSRMTPARSLLNRSSTSLHILTFDDRPGKLFDGLQHCRSAILVTRRSLRVNDRQVFTTGYLRWSTDARDTLFHTLEFTDLCKPHIFSGHFPKILTRIGQSVHAKLVGSGAQQLGDTLLLDHTESFVYYQEATQYWVKALIGLPYYAKNGNEGTPAHGRTLHCHDSSTCAIVTAILNSSLFYLYFIAYGDCFHLSDTLVRCFPVNQKVMCDSDLVELGRLLDCDLRRGAVRRTIGTRGGDRITYDEVFAVKSKENIDEIDRVLARYYGFSGEETDYIINYNIKYRMSTMFEE